MDKIQDIYKDLDFFNAYNIMEHASVFYVLDGHSDR